MSSWKYVTAAAVVALQLATANAQVGEVAQPLAKLNKRTESLLIQKIVPAYRMSNRLQLLEGLSTATARLKSEQMEAFDERLRMLAMPTAAKMMVDSYMSLLTQGLGDALPQPELREIIAMVPELDKSIEEVLVDVDDSVATMDPLPVLETLEDYEGLLWDIHVLENKMVYAGSFAKYGVMLIDHAKNQRSRGFEEQLEELSVDFSDRVNDLEAANADLKQRKMEFRLDRLALAKKTLGDADSTLMEKLQAAFAGQLDAAAFKQLFAGAEPPVFQRERLQDTRLGDNVAALSDEIEALSGDLKQKSNLLFRGLHWWQRGRFGRGPEQGGLLKNVRVVNDDRFLFPLFIPEDMGKPPFELIRNPEWGASETAGNDQPEVKAYIRVKTEGGLQPDFPRRHHYGWMFEYRQGVKAFERGTELVGTVGTRTVTHSKFDTRVFY